MAIIKCKINVKKIVKDKLFVGNSGTYLDCTLLENRDGTDQYGNDGMVIQDVSKAEREAGKRGEIIGNFKIMRQGSRPAPAPTSKPASDGPSEELDPPF